MSSILHLLTQAGWPLILGVTLILVLGYFGMRLSRTPIARQRLGELTLLASLLWLMTPWLPAWKTQGDTLRSLFEPQVASAPSHAGDSRERFPSNRSNRFASTIEVSEPDVGPVFGPQPNRKLDVAPSQSRLVQAGASNESDSIVEFAVQQPAEWPVVPAPANARATTTSSVAMLDEQRSTTSSVAPTQFPVAPIQNESATKGWPIPNHLAAGVFLAGAAICLGWLLLGRALLQVVVWRSQRLDSLSAKHDAAREHVAAVLQRCAPTVRPRVLISPTYPRAITFGAMRPTILLPAVLLDKSMNSTLTHVLIHEAGHVRQRDARGQLLMNVAFVLFYFHPMYWLVRKHICFERELVIDDWAASQTEKSKYVSDLIQLAKNRPYRLPGPSFAMGMADAGKSQFYRRIKMLLQRQHVLQCRRSMGVTALHGLIMTALVAGSMLFIDVPRASAQDQVEERLRRQVLELQEQRVQLEVKNAELSNLVAKLTAMVEETQVDRAGLMEEFNQMRANLQKEKEYSDDVREEILNRLSQSQDVSNHLRKQLAELQQEINRRNQAASNPSAGAVDRLNASPNEPIKDSPRTNQPGDEDPFARDIPKSEKSSPPAITREAYRPGQGISNPNQSYVDLAIQFTEAVGERNIAEAEFEAAKAKSSQFEENRYVIRVAKIRLENASRKVDVLEKLVMTTLRNRQAALRQAEKALDHTVSLAKKGYVKESAIDEAKMKLINIQMTLELLSDIIAD